jgi:hypothetical protein
MALVMTPQTIAAAQQLVRKWRDAHPPTFYVPHNRAVD